MGWGGGKKAAVSVEWDAGGGGGGEEAAVSVL